MPVTHRLLGRGLVGAGRLTPPLPKQRDYLAAESREFVGKVKKGAKDQVHADRLIGANSLGNQFGRAE